MGRFFVYFAGVLERPTGFHVGLFAHLLMLAGILRYGYDSVTYENVQYPNKVRAHLDIPPMKSHSRELSSVTAVMTRRIRIAAPAPAVVGILTIT